MIAACLGDVTVMALIAALLSPLIVPMPFFMSALVNRRFSRRWQFWCIAAEAVALPIFLHEADVFRRDT